MQSSILSLYALENRWLDPCLPRRIHAASAAAPSSGSRKTEHYIAALFDNTNKSIS
jgi:hypothetical protein